jgi:hypothetical protein
MANNFTELNAKEMTKTNGGSVAENALSRIRQRISELNIAKALKFLFG